MNVILLIEVVHDNGSFFFIKTSANQKIVEKYLYEYMVICNIHPDTKLMEEIFSQIGYSYEYVPKAKIDIYNVFKTNDYLVAYLGK